MGNITKQPQIITSFEDSLFQRHIVYIVKRNIVKELVDLYNQSMDKVSEPQYEDRRIHHKYKSDTVSQESYQSYMSNMRGEPLLINYLSDPTGPGVMGGSLSLIDGHIGIDMNGKSIGKIFTHYQDPLFKIFVALPNKGDFRLKNKIEHDPFKPYADQIWRILQKTGEQPYKSIKLTNAIDDAKIFKY